MKITSITPLQGEVTDNAPAQGQTVAATPPVEAPLDESAGLNSSVEDAAEAAAYETQNQLKRQAPEILKGITSGDGAQIHFKVPSLRDSVFDNIAIKVSFVPDTGTDMLRVKGASFPGFDELQTSVELEIGFGSVFTHAPQIYQQKSLNRLAASEEVKMALVHEFNHGIEQVGRAYGGQEWGGSNTTELASLLLSDKTPELGGLGYLIYLVDNGELNARVAEVGTLMKNALAGSSNEDLIQTIKDCRVWGEMKRLVQFDPGATYTSMISAARAKLGDKLPAQEKVAAEYVAKSILLALHKMVLAEYPNAANKTSNRIERIIGASLKGKDYVVNLRQLLAGFKELFQQKGEDLKRRIFKTISLAKREDAPVAQPQPAAALAEEELVEAYPASFDMGAFRELRNFKQRIDYCEQHLKRLGSGSARIAYEVDGDKVLKLAKNAKGIAQNEAEGQGYLQHAYGDIITKRFENHPDDLWIEMEKARKITAAKFRSMTGVSLEDLQTYVQLVTNPQKYARYTGLDSHVRAMCDDSDFVQMVTDMTGSMDMHPGDMGRPSTWGIVHRDGQERVVMIDYGLTNGVHADHYTRKTNRHQAYAGY
jgi:hypothetical protein